MSFPVNYLKLNYQNNYKNTMRCYLNISEIILFLLLLLIEMASSQPILLRFLHNVCIRWLKPFTGHHCGKTILMCPLGFSMGGGTR